MFNSIRLFIWSKAFIISILLVLIETIFFHDSIIFPQSSIEFMFSFFLALLPLILSVFAILISFTDKSFLKFLEEKKIYEKIILYFVNNTFIVFLSLLVSGAIISTNIAGNNYVQYLMTFLFTYTVISFIQLTRFIFYFSRKKAEYVKTVAIK